MGAVVGTQRLTPRTCLIVDDSRAPLVVHSPGGGVVETLAKHYSKLVKRTIDPLQEVTVTVGATEALFCAMQAMINEGDEVVVLEPAFDM